MKKICFLTILSLLSYLSVFGQLNIDSLYQNKKEYLIYSKIVSFDSIPANKIVTSVKNWGSTNFVNMSKTLVSETENQMVFDYITDSFYYRFLGMQEPISWYIRLVIQIKNNKIRMLFYDDGNVYMSGSTTTYGSHSSTPARTYKLSHYFYDNGIAPKIYSEGLNNVLLSCKLSSFEIAKTIKNGVNSNNEW